MCSTVSMEATSPTSAEKNLRPRIDVLLLRKRRQEIRRELWERRCRNELLPWCIEALEPAGLLPAKHHRLIISELEKVISGQCKRLMLFAPPGSAKSTYVT